METKIKKMFLRSLLVIGVPLVIFWGIAGSSSSWAINTAATGFRINHGSRQFVNAHGVCQDVINNSGSHIFVPTKTAAEWNAFRGHLPRGVGLGACFTYQWIQNAWSACSASCGVGARSSVVWCRRSDGAHVADTFCNPATKPATSQACDTRVGPGSYSGFGCEQCPNSWNLVTAPRGQYGECNQVVNGGCVWRKQVCGQRNRRGVVDWWHWTMSRESL
jgi:hypothetical protein